MKYQDIAAAIVEGCEKLADGRKPCVRQMVYAMLVTTDGTTYFGSNWMGNKSVVECPRDAMGFKSGEGYHLCKEHCQQAHHAEPSALAVAGSKAAGGAMYLTGHTYCCDSCLSTMKAAGVVSCYVIDSGKEYVL